MKHNSVFQSLLLLLILIFECQVKAQDNFYQLSSIQDIEISFSDSGNKEKVITASVIGFGDVVINENL